MPDHRGQRHQGAPLKRYKDSLKSHLKLCGFKPEILSSSSQSRSSWRHDCKEGIIEFEEARIAEQVEKRYHRKQAVCTATTSTNQQNVCNRCAVVKFVVPELDFTPIKDHADDTRTHDDEIRRSTAHSIYIVWWGSGLNLFSLLANSSVANLLQGSVPTLS